MTGTEIIEVTRSGKWHPARPSTPTETDEAGVEEENEVWEVVEVEPNRQQTDEDLIRDWLLKTTLRNANTTGAIHNWLVMQHGRDVPVARIEELVWEIEPQANGKAEAGPKAQEPSAVGPKPNSEEAIRTFIEQYFQTHSRDERSAETIQALYEDKTGLTIGITPIQKFIRQIAPLPRGRKAKVQQQPGVGGS
jgi:hypothetical protein